MEEAIHASLLARTVNGFLRQLSFSNVGKEAPVRPPRVNTEKMFEVLADIERFKNKPTGLAVYELRQIKDTLHWINIAIWIVTLTVVALGVGICTVSFEGA